MKSRIQTWGNSLALRIPKSFALEVGLKSNSPVEIFIDDKKLVIVSDTEPEFSLDKLLEQVTQDNLHGEVKTGLPLGKEIW